MAERVFVTLDPDTAVVDLGTQAEFEIHHTAGGEQELPATARTRFMVVGDPHFKLSAAPLLSAYIQRVARAIDLHRPDAVILLGDLLHDHESLHTSVLNYMYQFIHEVRTRAKCYILVGNHDYINNQQFLSTCHWMNALKEWDNVTIVDSGHTIVEGAQRFVLCPYVFPGRFVEALDTIDAEWRSATAIFAHQEIHGCRMNTLTSNEGDVWDASWPLVISGHIHDKHRPQTNVFYTGSSIQHAFGESHNKTIALVTVTGASSVCVEKIRLHMPEKRIVYETIESVQQWTAARIGAIPPNERVRITINGTATDLKLFKKSKQHKLLARCASVKVALRPILATAPTVTGEEGERRATLTRQPYRDILRTLVQESGNPAVMHMYTELVGSG